jgi:protein-L-isoaspartate(D-aspartate) O-methyltransferase
MRWEKFITGLLAIVVMGQSELVRAEDGEVKSREEMVRNQLAAGGIRKAEVLQAMAEVPRHEFVPASFGRLTRTGLCDWAWPDDFPAIYCGVYDAGIGAKQGRYVLEIGTGSGYQAAILGKLTKEVYTIEIVPPLAESARAVLSKLGFENVHVRQEMVTWAGSEKAPFDAIIVTCAPDHVPEPLISQLKEGGRLVIPVGATGGIQQLVLLRKRNGQISKEKMLDVRFVPMTGKMTDE